MKQSNDKIKGPVRVATIWDREVLDADATCILVARNGHAAEIIHKLNGYDEAMRGLKGISDNAEEITHKLDGYGVAVDALRDIHSDGDGWGKSLAWEALKELGELDNDGADSGPETAYKGQAGRTSTVGGSTTPESPRRKGSGQGSAPTQQRDRDAECNDSGNDSERDALKAALRELVAAITDLQLGGGFDALARHSNALDDAEALLNPIVCAFDECDDPVGVDPQYCPFHSLITLLNPIDHAAEKRDDKARETKEAIREANQEAADGQS